MLKEHKKSCSICLIIREVGTKTTVKHHLTSTRRLEWKRQITRTGEDVDEPESPQTPGRKVAGCSTAQTASELLKGQSIITTQPCNAAPRSLPKGDENICPCKTCTWMFTAAASVTAKRQKQSKCPATDKSINKMQCLFRQWNTI